jgi:hypothetical protein
MRLGIISLPETPQRIFDSPAVVTLADRIGEIDQ